jgi:uncharacterized FlgJ-related protein
MRIQKIIITIGVLIFLTGCINGKKHITSTSGQLSELDSIICSSPQNHSRVSDNVKASGKVEIRSYKDILELFEKLKYTPESWQAGIREVPRVYLPIIGDKWGSTRSKEVTVENKKRLFFRVLAPLVLRANELIMIDRDRLQNIKSSFSQNTSIPENDQAWIKKISLVYKVNLDDGQVTTSILDELWEKVDIVPVSLALAQAAEESGWGTSRFAAQGNAVYGQWTWGENAIKPEQQRKELGNYGIASFETLQQSVSAYMLNLNTHNAYSSLRGKRAELRKNSEDISGYILAGQLTKYSERGEDYVKGLRSLMDINRLAPADDAYLSKNPPIYLVPVAE